MLIRVKYTFTSVHSSLRPDRKVDKGSHQYTVEGGNTVVDSPASLRTRSKVVASKQTADESERSGPSLIAYALIATELSKPSRFGTPYCILEPELLCGGNGVNPKSQNG